tara:strand:- start:1090 stop:1443 length:354 start_codon:yes stop_codon:yes gene_type:complete
MNTLADLEKPPFYTALYLSAPQGSDEGLHSEAISIMLSLAMMLTGFVGFRDDDAAENRRVRIVFWKDYHTMKAWEKTARGLLPHRVQLKDCLASKGCMWQWLDDGAETSMTPMINAA